MYKITILAAFILTAVEGNTQLLQQDSALPKAAIVDYLKLSKKQKICGWAMFGTSAVTGLTGLSIVTKEGGNLFNDGRNTGACIIGGCSNPPEDTYNDRKATSGVVLLGISAVSLVTSIVLFTKSGQNKRRAMSVSFKPVRAPVLLPAGTVALKPIPSLTIKCIL